MSFTIQKLVYGGLWVTLASVGASAPNANQALQFWKSQSPQNIVRLVDCNGNVIAQMEHCPG